MLFRPATPRRPERHISNLRGLVDQCRCMGRPDAVPGAERKSRSRRSPSRSCAASTRCLRSSARSTARAPKRAWRFDVPRASLWSMISRPACASRRPGCRAVMTSPRRSNMLKRWPAFTLFLDDGRVCMSTMWSSAGCAASLWGGNPGCFADQTAEAGALRPCTVSRHRQDERRRSAGVAHRRPFAHRDPSRAFSGHCCARRLLAVSVGVGRDGDACQAELSFLAPEDFLGRAARSSPTMRSSSSIGSGSDSRSPGSLDFGPMRRAASAAGHVG